MKFYFLTILLIALTSCSNNDDKSKPNFVIIFMDDLGYGDIENFGAINYQTPNISNMVNRGMLFTNFYSAQAVCSASRAGLLTGTYPNRIGIGGALMPYSEHGLHKDEKNDLTIYSNNVDGMGFEIFTKKALMKSHKLGKTRHRSELCDLYIRENIQNFKVSYNLDKLTKIKFRLTVDNPEDLILCKKIFKNVIKSYPNFTTKKILNFLENKNNIGYIKLVNQFISKSKTIDNLWKNAK